MISQINQVLDFIVEIEKLKAVIRKSRPVGLKRFENSAEHSWHVCLSALMLKDYADENIDINRVIKMLLIHDLGEIDADDKIIYSSQTEEQKLKEEAGVVRLLHMLPEHMRAEHLDLFREFEAGNTPESKYAKAIDRIPPLLHNINDDGYGWKKHGISKEQVFSLNGERISKGSKQIWSAIEEKLNQAVEDGLLK